MAISTIRNYNLFKIDLLFTFIYRLLPQKPHSQEEFSMLNKERLKNVFYDMVKIYSPSKGEGEICAWVMDYLRARGLEPEIDEAGKAYGGNGGNIIVHVPGEKADDPICFMGHLDQIEPCKNVNPIMDGSVIRTDGTTTLGADNKSAAASIFEAYEDLRESGVAHKEFYMLFSVSEEINMQGVKHLDPKRLPCKSFVVPDATGPLGTIITAAPAANVMKVTIKGRTAHAGIEPEKGINAIVAASKAIAKMHIGRIDFETTSNIGHIEGGTATNIVTDSVWFTAEIRSRSDDKLAAETAYMEKCVRDACAEMGAECVWECEHVYPRFVLGEDSPIYKRVTEAMKAEGVTPIPTVTGGGFDASVLCGLGCESAVISTGMKDVHTKAESIDLEDMWKITHVISRLMRS